MKSTSKVSLIASPMQSSMLMPLLRGDASQHYVQQQRWTFWEPVDWEIHKKAWKRVFNRHDVFKHQFQLSDTGEVVIVKKRCLQVEFDFEDWSDLSMRNQRIDLAKFLKNDLNVGFVARKEPLCRLKLIRLAANHSELVLTSHHALFDGRGRLVLIQEFQQVLDAYKTGKSIRLPKAPAFSSFLEWIQEKSWKSSKQFWRGQLKRVDDVTPLEIGYGSEPQAKASGYRVDRSMFLSRKQSDFLHRWSKKTGITINTLVQAAWSIFLHRTSGKDVIVFAAPRACRKSAVTEAEHTVGVFTNTVPVVVHIEDRETVENFLNRIQDNWRNLRSFEHTPYRVVKEASNTPANKPLYSSIAGFENYQLDKIFKSENDRPYRLSVEGYTEIPLSLYLLDGNSIRMEITYDRSRFSKATIDQLGEIFRHLVHQLVETPELNVDSIELLNKKECARIIKLGTGKRPKLNNRTIQREFEIQAKKHAHRIAVRSNGNSFTYGQLNQQANKLARYLIKKGVKSGLHVGLLLDRDYHFIVAQLAVLKAGGVYVPLNVTHPKDRTKEMLKNARPAIVLTHSKVKKSIASKRINLICLDQLDKHLARFSKTNLNSNVSWHAPAYTMYTSGSTGLPKGVTVPHAGIVRLVCKAGYVKLSTNTRSLQLTSITFDLSVFEIWGPLLNGGTCILYPGPEPQYSKLQHIIRSESVNTMLLSASVFNSIVDTSPAILKGIRQLVIGAEALSSAHVKKALRALPEMTIINGYGPTEASALAICHTVSRNQTAKKSVPIGSPINHSIAYILDTKGRLLPTGVPGELHLGGIGLAIGYFRNRKQTEERFISKPFGRKSDTNLFRTGDRVFLNAEGNFDYIERMDDQVKIRGHRIEPGEIRSQIRNLKGCSDCFGITPNTH